VKDFSPRDLVAGALLIALVVVVAVFVDSDRPVFEDEAMVLAAISAVAPADENCDISYGLNSDELNTDYQLMGGYGVTWGLPHADDTITTVVIKCVVSEDVHGPNWDQWGVRFDLRLRYPLKSGSHAEEINDLIRRDVTAMISQYLINARDRVRSGGGPLTGLPDDSSHRWGELDITGFASFMNDDLYSVGLHSSAHDPTANTSENYLRTLNYDLTTGQQFFLIQLTDNDDREGYPAWSPNGDKIAFTSSRGSRQLGYGDAEIFLMDAAGGNIVQITDNEDDDGYPAWSPDGNKIAFVSDRSGGDEIFVMDADGTNVVDTGQAGIPSSWTR
ncbi:uncharacterized protein METZ01_LOCUS200731, partial [marine metagenome]